MGKRSRQNLKLISYTINLVAPARVTDTLILDFPRYVSFCYFKEMEISHIEGTLLLF